MNDIIQNFQFIRPLCLLAILPVFVVYLLKLKFGQQQNLWQQILPQHLYQKLVISKGLQKNSHYIHYAFFAWLVSVLAIAGPTWEKLPQAVYQTQAGKVILMDMSMSMRSTDLSPNRLTRARFKAIDLINQVSEGETGLVAYAGDAFIISPLTDDANTLINLIPSLRPEIMPSQGSLALSGLELAAELLRNAGYKSGQIYWLTDGIVYDEIRDIREFIQNSEFDVSALLVGTENGAPIQMQDGKLLKDKAGSIVVPSINSRYLNQAMLGTDGTYSVFASDNSDIAAIKRKVEYEQQQEAQEVENTSGDVFKDMGPYLLILVLPFAAYAFRRGLLVVGMLSLLLIQPEPALAWQQNEDNNKDEPVLSEAISDTDATDPSRQSVKDWFKNADQRGKQAFDKQDYSRANALFEDPEWRAAAAYKNGDYQQALDLYNSLEGKENTYNKGNALAKLGKLQGAIDEYNKVIEQDNTHEQAIKNKTIIEELLKQQQEQEDQEQSEGDNQDSEQQDSDEQNSDEQSADEQSSEQQDSNEHEQSEQQDGDNSDSESNKNQSEQDSSEQNDADENNEKENSEQNNAEQKQDENLKRQAQQQAEQESEQQEQQSQQEAEQQERQQAPQQGAEDEQQEAISAEQFNTQDMTPEEKEEMQRMQMIMNKVTDDPAYLLQRKMMLEAYKRERRPPPTQENW